MPEAPTRALSYSIIDMAESILANSYQSQGVAFHNEIYQHFDSSSYSTPSSSGSSYQPSIPYTLNIPQYLSSVEITTPPFNIPVVEIGGYGYCNVNLAYGSDTWGKATTMIYLASGPNQNNVADSYTLTIPSFQLVLYAAGDIPLWGQTSIPFRITFNICQASYTVPAVSFTIRY